MMNQFSYQVADHIKLFEGSFVASAVWWLLGADIGPDVYLDRVVITEPDLLKIGEGSVVARGTKLWLHKFQDWKLDLDRIVLGKRVNIGANCLICMDTRMGDDSVLGACSVIMQQQTLEESALFFGNPADRVMSARAAEALPAPRPSRAPMRSGAGSGFSVTLPPSSLSHDRHANCNPSTAVSVSRDEGGAAVNLGGVHERPPDCMRTTV